MARMRIFVAGPLTQGFLVDNIKRANLAGLELIRSDYAPLIPHLSAYLGSPIPQREPCGVGWMTWLEITEAWLVSAHAVLRLPGKSGRFGPGVPLGSGARHSGIREYRGVETKPTRWSKAMKFPFPLLNLWRLCREENRKLTLAGIRFECREGKATATATNGHVIVQASFAGDWSLGPVLLPRDVAREAKRAAKRYAVTECELTAAENEAVLTVDGVCLLRFCFPIREIVWPESAINHINAEPVDDSHIRFDLWPKLLRQLTECMEDMGVERLSLYPVSLCNGREPPTIGLGFRGKSECGRIEVRGTAMPMYPEGYESEPLPKASS